MVWITLSSRINVTVCLIKNFIPLQYYDNTHTTCIVHSLCKEEAQLLQTDCVILGGKREWNQTLCNSKVAPFDIASIQHWQLNCVHILRCSKKWRVNGWKLLSFPTSCAFGAPEGDNTIGFSSIFAVKKLKCLHYHVVLTEDDALSSSDTVLMCDKQTDRH